MRYLLDTNVCVDILSQRYPEVAERLRRCSPEDLCISSVVVAELRYGADKSQRSAENHRRIDLLLGDIPCFDFDPNAASVYGRIRTDLEKRGEPIGPYDLMIAAHALSLRLTLVSDNVRECKRVKGLQVDNWRVSA
jgi:tRNA(fMet)-specific endonuclease VapC